MEIFLLYNNFYKLLSIKFLYLFSTEKIKFYLYKNFSEK